MRKCHKEKHFNTRKKTKKRGPVQVPFNVFFNGNGLALSLPEVYCVTKSLMYVVFIQGEIKPKSAIVL